jgi:hypothetical protein
MAQSVSRMQADMLRLQAAMLNDELSLSKLDPLGGEFPNDLCLNYVGDVMQFIAGIKSVVLNRRESGPLVNPAVKMPALVDSVVTRTRPTHI